VHLFINTVGINKLSVNVFVGTGNGHYDALQPVEAKGRVVISV
jgi:hypothetical protein